MLCTEINDYIEDDLHSTQRTAIWCAELASGVVAYMDDRKNDSAWLRLKKHCSATGDFIVKLWLKFRTNELRNILPENASGYHFSKVSGSVLGSKETSSFLCVGAVMDNHILVKKFRNPELTPFMEERRELDPHSDCVILRPCQ